MRDEVIVGPTVAAIADPSAVGDLSGYTFRIGDMHFHNGQTPAIFATGFSGSETVNLWRLSAGTWHKVYDAGGSPVQLTATHQQESIFTQGVYGVTKSADTGITVSVTMP